MKNSQPKHRSPKPLTVEERSDAWARLQSSDKSVIVKAAHDFSGDYETTTLLRELLRTELRPDNRQGILYALAWHGDTSLWSVFLEVVSNKAEAPQVRGQAAEGVAYLFLDIDPSLPDFSHAGKVLIESLSDESAEVRYCSLHALGCSGHLPFMSSIEKLLDDHAVVPGFVGTVGEQALRSCQTLIESANQRVTRQALVDLEGTGAE